ncbi:MAG: hypothetical protein P4L65_05235 [Legionella sp.]|nr:hypothetical protein [Legionella sp.]
MNGFSFKTGAFVFALLAVSSVFAASTATDTNNTKMFHAKLGCMSCHQGEAIQTDKHSKKTQDNLRHQK